MNREDWLKERKTGIGGSDAASVFNVGYGCRRRLFYDKRGVEPDYEQEETLPMLLGNTLEDFFAQQYVKKTGYAVSASESRQHPEFPEARVNPDRLIWKNYDEPFGVLEIKSQSAAVFSKTKREGLHEGYILQLEHGMFVTGAQWGAFQIGNRDTGQSTDWEVTPNASIQSELRIEIPRIWAQIQDPTTPLPERLEVDDYRCSGCPWRKTCQGDALIHVTGESDLVTVEEIRPLLVDYDTRKALLEEAEALMEETTEAIKTALVSVPAARLAWDKGERRIYYRGQNGRTTWNAAEMAKKYEELRSKAEDTDGIPEASHFKKQGLPYRTLRIF